MSQARERSRVREKRIPLEKREKDNRVPSLYFHAPKDRWKAFYLNGFHVFILARHDDQKVGIRSNQSEM